MELAAVSVVGAVGHGDFAGGQFVQVVVTGAPEGRVNRHARAPFVQMTRRDEAVPAVVAGASEDHDVPSFKRAEEHPRLLRDGEARLLHQLRLGDARSDGSRFQLAHLGAGDEFHRSPFSRISRRAASPRRGVSSASVIARSPTTDAIAKSLECVSEISRARISICSARAAPRP